MFAPDFDEIIGIDICMNANQNIDLFKVKDSYMILIAILVILIFSFLSIS